MQIRSWLPAAKTLNDILAFCEFSFGADIITDPSGAHTSPGYLVTRRREKMNGNIIIDLKRPVLRFPSGVLSTRAEKMDPVKGALLSWTQLDPQR